MAIKHMGYMRINMVMSFMFILTLKFKFYIEITFIYVHLTKRSEKELLQFRPDPN